MVDSVKIFVYTTLFGVRVIGEPANYPPKMPSTLPPLDKKFYSWAKEYKIGCAQKNTPAYWQ
jgi:hypothetical protein